MTEGRYSTSDNIRLEIMQTVDTGREFSCAVAREAAHDQFVSADVYCVVAMPKVLFSEL